MAVSITLGPPPVYAKNLFFKSFPEVFLGSPSPGLGESSTQRLDCSSKFGVLLVAGQKNMLILRAEDVIIAQSKAKNDHKKQIGLAEIPYISVNNISFGMAPTLVAVSLGEEFVALDTQKNGVPFVLVFKLEQFLLQGGGCTTFCEIRGSAKEGAKVTGIAWNPGESIGSMLSIISDDGSLQLATIKGEKAVEICSLKDGNAKCMCWSPKGKQLVIGRSNGNLSQLKLDLTEAKHIQGPGGSRIPSAIFWSSTTQFLINFVVEERDIDFMELNLVKGAPPLYSSFGDIFVSDKVSAASKCFFVTVHPWNTILCATNTINDVVVITKNQQGAENWVVADIDDTRRAAIPIDSFAVGATLYRGCETPVVFSETDCFGPMPVLFILSDFGALCSVSFVNSEPSTSNIIQKVSNPLSPTLFQTAMKEVERVTAAVPHNAPVSFSNVASSQSTQLLSHNNPLTSQKAVNRSDVTALKPQFEVPSAAQSLPLDQPKMSGLAKSATSKINQSFSSTELPTTQQLEDLKRIVENRKTEDKQQEDYDALLINLEKFNIRMTNFKTKQADIRNQVAFRLEEVCKKFEQEVLVELNILENFVGAINDTTKCQKEEVNTLKEGILSHFTQLEYVKSLAERNKDPRYIQLLRAQTLDPATLQKFQKVLTVFQYIKHQMHECDRFFKIQSQESRPLEGAAATQVIYLTLSNHSKVIKTLIQELNSMRGVVGLSKCLGLDDEMDVFQYPSLGYFEKKSVGKPNSSNTITEYKNSDRITLDDLTAGISRVKLDKEGKFAGGKPLKISAKKLQVLRRAVSKTVEIEVSSKDEAWMDPLEKLSNLESRELIRMLDDKILPPTAYINEKGDGFMVKSIPEYSTTPKLLCSKNIFSDTVSSSAKLTNTLPERTSGAADSETMTKQIGDQIGPPVYGITPEIASTSLFDAFGQTHPSLRTSSSPSLSDEQPGSTPFQSSSLLGTLPVSTEPILYDSSLESTVSPSKFNAAFVDNSSKSNCPRTTGVSSFYASSTTPANNINSLAYGNSLSPSPSAVISTSSRPAEISVSSGDINTIQRKLFGNTLTDPDVLGTKKVNIQSDIGTTGTLQTGVLVSATSGSPSTSSTFGLSSLSALLTGSSSQSNLFGTPSFISNIPSLNLSGTPATPSKNSSQPSLLGGTPISSSSLLGTLALETPPSQPNLLGLLPKVCESSMKNLPDLKSASISPSTLTTVSSIAVLELPTSSTSSQQSLSSETALITSVKTSPFVTSVVSSNSNSQSKLFCPQPVTTFPSSLFGSPSPSNLFGNPLVTADTPKPVFGAQPGVLSQKSLFGSGPRNFPESGSTFIGAVSRGSSVESFGNPPTFGGFGSSSPFGSAFGSSASPITSTGFGIVPSSGSNIFGGTTDGANSGGTTATNATFGSLSPTVPIASAHPNVNIFGSPSHASTTSSQHSIFAASSQPSFSVKSTISPPSGLFSAAAVGIKPGFGNTGGVFGGSSTFDSSSGFGSSFSGGTPANPCQSSLFGVQPTSLSQPGLLGSAVGNKPGGFGNAPVFGSTSPFGSAFGSAGRVSMGFGESLGSSSSIFGGSNAPTFGGLAQTVSVPQSTYGVFGTPNQTQSSPFAQTQQPPPAFGQIQQQSQPPSVFGQTPPASASFGGSAFSSWR